MKKRSKHTVVKDGESLHHKELRREIYIGIEHANRGDLAPLDIKSIKDSVRERLKKTPGLACDSLQF